MHVCYDPQPPASYNTHCSLGRDSEVFYAAGKSSQVFEFSLAEDRVTRIFSLPDGSGAVASLTVFPGPFYGQVGLGRWFTGGCS